MRNCRRLGFLGWCDTTSVVWAFQVLVYAGCSFGDSGVFMILCNFRFVFCVLNWCGLR